MCVCWVVSPVEEIVSKCKFKIYCNILLGRQYDAVCQIHFMPPHSLLLLTSWHSNGAWRWRRVFQLMLLKYFQCKRLWKSPVKDLQTSHEKRIGPLLIISSTLLSSLCARWWCELDKLNACNLLTYTVILFVISHLCTTQILGIWDYIFT